MIRDDGQPLKLNTANGQIGSTSCVSIGSACFELPIEACVLENNTNVLSVGKLCNGMVSKLERAPNSHPDIAGWFDDSPQSEILRSIFRRM